MTNYDNGEYVTITAGMYEGERGKVVGEDDRFGEAIVKFMDGDTAIVPDDALEVDA